MASPVKGFIGVVLVAASFLNPVTAIWGGKLAVAMFAAGANLIQTSARGPLTQQQQGIQQNVTSTEQPLPVIYGRAKIGMAVTDIRVDTDSDDDRDLYLVGALCIGSEDGNGIEAVEKVWLDERLAIDPPVAGDLPQETNVQDGFKAREGVFGGNQSMLAYGLHLGTDAQTTDSHLVSTFAEYTTGDPSEEGKGIAYLALRLRHHEDVYSGIPNITAQVQGQQVYDPRSSTWGWSDNPALCALDYLTSKRYGLGADYSERDGGTESEIEEQSFIDAANYFDELVSIPGGTTQKRATCNGIIFTGDTVGANLQALLSAGRGQIVYEGGKFRYIVHRATTAETFELTEDNIVGDIEFLVGGTKETANRMLATFVDPDLDWQPDDVAWPEADATNTFLTNDGDFENVREIDLPFTTDRYMAQQQLQVALRESRADLGIGLTAKEEALKLRVGSLVKVTHSDPGWTEKEFWVNALAVTPDGTIRLILEEYDETAYTLDALSTKDSPPDTSLPDVYSVPAPTNLVLTSDDTTALGTQDGAKQPRIKVEWTAAENPFLDHYLIRYKPDAESQWLEAPNVPAEETSTLFGAVTDGVLYDVAVIAVNSMGKRSEALQGQVTVGTDVGTGGNPGAPAAPVFVNSWASPAFWDFKVQAEPGSSGDDPAEYRYEVVDEDGDTITALTAWTALAETSPGSGVWESAVIRVTRDGTRSRIIRAQVRDTAGRESDFERHVLVSTRAYIGDLFGGRIGSWERDEEDVIGGVTRDDSGQSVQAPPGGILDDSGLEQILDTEGRRLRNSALEGTVTVETSGRGVDTVDDEAHDARRHGPAMGSEGPLAVSTQEGETRDDSGNPILTRPGGFFDEAGAQQLISPEGEMQSPMSGPNGDGIEDIEDGGARGRAVVDASGKVVQDDVLIDDGAAVRTPTRGYETGAGLEDGDAVTFGQSYNNVPLVILQGGKTYSHTIGQSLSQAREVAAANLDAAGFDLRAKIVNRGATTARDDDFASGTITATGAANAKEANLANAPSSGDKYDVRWDVTVDATGTLIDCRLTLAIETNHNDGQGWIERDTVQYFVAAGLSNTWNDEIRQIVVSGLAADDDVRIYAKSFSGGGTFSIDPNDVQYTTSADTEESATESNASGPPPYPVSYQALGVA